MPPKAKAAVPSNAIIRTGPKEVSVHPSRAARRAQQGEKPTTQRALVLRNGKHGAMGTGEVIAHNKITGREKLDLLAEELMEKMKQAVMSPFKMEQALNIAQSQFGMYRDDIVNLKDPVLFRDLIEADLIARTRPGIEPRRNATNLAKVIGTRIHNSYMLASAWKIVADTLRSLAIDGLTDTNIKTKLKNDTSVRTRYLVLFDMVSNLVDMSHSKLAVLATTAPHYSPFFKVRKSEDAPDSEEIGFEWNLPKNLRMFTESFLDSIVLELCFPQGPIPRSVLYMLLHECIDESPNEAKRFSTAMYNALGDLSVSVQLQTLLEAPLFGPEGQQWRKEPRQMPEEFEKWTDAQFYSSKATSEVGNWKDFLNPWAACRKQDVLDKMWKAINLNFIKEAQIDMDRLWQLDNNLNVQPQWSAYWFDRLAEDSDEEGEDGGLPRIGGKKKKKPLALMAPGDEDDSAGSMPALQSVSNSSEDEDFSDMASDDDEEDEYTDDSAYDTDEEDEIRELMREAMEAGHDCDYDGSGPAPELDPLNSDERKGNPFLKALGSLRGRLFKSEPKISVTTQRSEPRPNARGAFRATKTGVPKPVPKTVPKPSPAGEQGKDDPSKPHKTTMEEVEDEDADVGTAAKKKKKKKGKKKKPTGEATSPTIQAGAGLGASASTANIPIAPTKAESTHSYLKTLEESKKDKVKSRPDHASIFSQDTQKKGGLFSKLAKGLGRSEEPKEHGDKNPKYTWFSRLSKKATDSMHQLLRTSEDAGKQPAPMKWETFLKLMREMGFECDLSTAGSSVRFDPPNKADSSISIHKPHPDSTLTPQHLRNIGRRLKKHYGWNEEDFIQQTRKMAA